MAETERSYSDLIANLPDNTSGLISPEDVRDALASSMGGYGGLATNSSQSMSSTIGTTPTKLVVYNGGFPGDGVNVVASAIDDNITIAVAGDYEVHFMCNTSSATDSEVYTFQLYNDGVAELGLRCSVPTSGGDLNYPAVFSGVVTVAAAATLEVRVNTISASRSLTTTEGQFWVRRIR